MSPENQGVFSALERGDFLKNSGILQFMKMGPFEGCFVRGLVRLSGQSQHLVISKQTRSQLGVIDVLYIYVVVYSKNGGGRSGLAENHEDRFHANRAVRDMR